MGIEVREAGPAYADWIVEQLRKFAEFFGSQRPLFKSEAHVRDLVRNLATNHVFLVAVDNCVPRPIELNDAIIPKGFIAGTLGPHPLNPDIIVLSEIFWWVDPAWRGTGVAGILLDAYVALGRDRADWITLATEAESPIREASITKRGFRLKERSYLMEVELPAEVKTAGAIYHELAGTGIKVDGDIDGKPAPKLAIVKGSDARIPGAYEDLNDEEGS